MSIFGPWGVCPRCQSALGCEELDWETCDTCGFPETPDNEWFGADPYDVDDFDDGYSTPGSSSVAGGER